MIDKNTDSSASSMIRAKCPGCGAIGPLRRWEHKGRLFESVDCVACGRSSGRIVGGTSTQVWHDLGPAIHTDHSPGLKVSRRA